MKLPTFSISFNRPSVEPELKIWEVFCYIWYSSTPASPNTGIDLANICMVDLHDKRAFHVLMSAMNVSQFLNRVHRSKIDALYCWIVDSYRNGITTCNFVYFWYFWTYHKSSRLIHSLQWTSRYAMFDKFRIMSFKIKQLASQEGFDGSSLQ